MIWITNVLLSLVRRSYSRIPLPLPIQSARIYLVQFIRLLFRLRLPFLASWCVDLIVKLCLDPCPQIARSALHLLEETCWDTVNVQAITRHILTDPNPPPSTSPTSNPASTYLTPFGLRLLDPSTGPVVTPRFGLFSGSKSSPASQPSAAVKDGPNSALSDSGFLQTPLEWMLDMARRRYNLAYAAEIDNRLSRLFVGHTPGRDQMTTNKCIDDTLSRRFPWFSSNGIACHRESVDNSQSLITAGYSEGDVDGESDTSTEVDQNRPSNRESSPHYQRDRVNAHSVYYDTLRCLPLPKHLYGCLAEHPAGLDLLIERGDLQTVLDVLNASSSVYLPSSTSPSPDAPNILATKAALWALAHVGSATSGQLWFTRQQPGLIDLFQRFATEATSTGLRATAWLCLNLLACKPGMEQILAHPQKDTSVSRTSWVVGRSSTGLTNPVSVTPMHAASNVVFDYENTHANKPIFSVSPLMEIGANGIPNGEVRESASSSDPLVMSVNDKREQNGSLLARAIGNHNSLSLRTTKRWFPRRLSPRVKHSTTTASDSFESSNSRRNSSKSSELRYASLTSHSDRAVVRGDNKNGLEEFPNWNLPEVPGLQCDRQRQLLPNPQHHASGFQEIPAVARNSATWTHRDLLPHRRSVWELHPTGSNPNPIDNRPVHESNAICSTTVCLPLDVRVLGRSVLRVHTVDEFGSSTDSSSPGSKSLFIPYGMPTARRSLLSFVHVASSAQSVLMHAQEIQRQLDQDIGQFDLSTTNPTSKSECSTSVTTVNIKTPTKRTSNGSVSNRFNGVSLTDEQICSNTSDATLTSCVEHNTYNPCIIRYKNDRPPLSNSISNRTRVWCPNKPATEGCLSRSCRLSSLCRLSAVSCTPQETPDDKRAWSSQLFCIVTGLLANVFSTAHEQALHHLIQTAQRSQPERNDVCPSSLDKPLFDACVYTRVARLLATYTFPLEARVKIQSALLGLEIHELFTDARNAVSELEKAVRSHPGLVDVEQSISSNSAIPLQRPQNFHTSS
ncbi:hypothetical protein PHET_09561 [Paragonimus heterotremus]|uniref:Rapamycin-insensitive companion of mTOR domain-containing protein n=1 Tax=Paragonimus heterotremus TaxID=100268 RepID=A0A8J4WU71_9TREM|nr:hypothetical protein PHET_09561 [Paragonimus heterotremus]